MTRVARAALVFCVVGAAVAHAFPATTLNVAGISGSGAVSPPDVDGAVGPNHYVQVTNVGYEIWNKAGTVVQAQRALNTLWTGYVGTHAGNGCATRNDGSPIVVYDQLADRWVIAQLSIPNLLTAGGPSFECVAVSKTGDPTGAWWLYDFQFNVSVNDAGKLGVWRDAYYGAFSNFDGSTATFVGPNLCAFDRTAMLAGQAATVQCFPQAATLPVGVLPVNLDGAVSPPAGEPGFFIALGTDAAGAFNNTLDLWKLHVDFAVPANSTLTGPVQLAVGAYTGTCGPVFTTGCIPENAGGTMLRSMADRLSYRASYRNFGTHESVIVNHAVVAGATSGVRWYELAALDGTPLIAQQGTYAPADTTWRWMGSMAQDQAQDIALGFSAASTTLNPQIAWTGRLATDAASTLPQGEAVVQTGPAHETGGNRWGDYTSMTVDPSDDCTYWYTNEYYPTNGTGSWATRIATVKFPRCAANNFTITLGPVSQVVVQGSHTDFTVTTTPTAGTAETVTLTVQDLPAGVVGTFNPPTVTAGESATLTLTADLTTNVMALAPFRVIGTTASAVHQTSAQLAVTPCVCPDGFADDGGPGLDNDASTGGGGGAKSGCCGTSRDANGSLVIALVVLVRLRRRRR